MEFLARPSRRAAPAQVGSGPAHRFSWSYLHHFHLLKDGAEIVLTANGPADTRWRHGPFVGF